MLIRRRKQQEPVQKQKNSDACSIKQPVEFLSTGCTPLDFALSGGKPNGGVGRGRVFNVVGEGSAGKTLLALEILAHAFHHLKKTQSKIWPEVRRLFLVFNNTEGVMDFPLDKMYSREFIEAVEWVRKGTAESMGRDFSRRVKKLKKGHALIYVTDSWDGLKSENESETFAEEAKKDKVEQGGYNLSKQQYTHRFFRNIADALYGVELAKKLEKEEDVDESDLNKKDATLIITSQIKHKMNASPFEKPFYRTGGSALDFWTHQVLWLYKAGKLFDVKERKKFVYGMGVRAVVERNKVGKPFRECKFPIILDYGIDNITAILDEMMGAKKVYCYDGEKFKTKKKLIRYIEDNNLERQLKKEYREWITDLEKKSEPVRKRKYE